MTISYSICTTFFTRPALVIYVHLEQECNLFPSEDQTIGTLGLKHRALNSKLFLGLLSAYLGLLEKRFYLDVSRSASIEHHLGY